MAVEELLAQIERAIRFGLAVTAAYLVALWIAAAWWAYRDIRARTTDIFLQMAGTLLVVVFSFPGLLIYFMLRPSRTLQETYEEALEEQGLLQDLQVVSACPACKRHTEPDFLFCPWCQTRLRRACARCERPLMLRWKACPYCGEAVPTPAPPTSERVPEPARPRRSV